MTQTSTETHVEVDTMAGRVCGAWRGTPGAPGASAAFLGIPFAEAPVDELRFAAPVPHRPWSGVRNALQFGATAQRGDPGVTLIPEPSVPGDSILNVNVFTPSPTRAADGAGLPVLVWIHGGGYFAGSPASPWYDGRAFNRDGVVTVTISYRLGFDGFGWIADAPMNRGVLDWLLALEWVRDNIAAFGGDPSRVTIAGQSAGGGAVLTLLGMPRAQGLFHGAVAVSGATADVAPERAELLGRRVAELAGVEPTRAGLSTVDEARLIELQQHASEPVSNDAMAALTQMVDDGLAFGPAIDGVLITRPTRESIGAGVGAHVPLLLGATDDEFAMIFTAAAKKLRFIPARFLLGRVSRLPSAVRRAWLAENHDIRARGTAAVLGRFVTDRMFRTSVPTVARLRGDAPTWTYRFAWRSPVFDAAVHCVDVPFFFDCLDAVQVEPLAGSNPPQPLADEVHARAVAFVCDGDPGWPRYTPNRRIARVYDTPSADVSDAYAGVRSLLSA
ncbi:carboxylesterase/lipase family protein [Agromyces bauzanensis]|uniref:Carboxylic ester hydrolase n=1 Tax=Agromyces bauzanensis TaxID=1308924 RepID=A0A917PVA7_9MICO|nr:carboxylesterase family protein [Agromyces bauzanensis]GGJ93186.1 carboxylic ester hydrolase [Agromyces bauzanensis]